MADDPAAALAEAHSEVQAESGTNDHRRALKLEMARAASTTVGGGQ